MEMKALSSPEESFLQAIFELYLSLTPYQKSVVMLSNIAHGGALLFPIVLAMGRCNPNEYASGVVAANFEIAGVFAEATNKSHREMHNLLKDNARTAIEFLSYCNLAQRHLEAEIASGEGKDKEFKSTLRWNVKANRIDDSMTHSCLKTIAAFLNTDGGVLFIGVDDDGNPVGLESDEFPSEDKFLLHLFAVIKQSMGDAAGTMVDARILTYRGKRICRVECGTAQPNQPVFLRFKSAEEEFFVRTGPGTTKLAPSQIMRYMNERNQVKQ